jgi:dihydrofolate reductase
MHLAIVPILLGGGERLFDNLDGDPVGYECVELASSSSVVHARFTRTHSSH